MNKEDWLDYFEAVNGRDPFAKEIAEALAAGEFQNDAVTAESSKEKNEPTPELEAAVSEEALSLIHI